MSKFVTVSVEERLIAWRQLDSAATAAEAKVRQLGQGASDPATRDLLAKAREMRACADREFAAILRAVRLDDAGDGHGESANDQGGAQKSA